MNVAELLIEAFSRIPDEAARVLTDLSDADLAARPDHEANTIAWLLWHTARVQDAQVAEVADEEEAWTADGWVDRFGLPFSSDVTGYGQTAAEVGQVRVGAGLLTGYLADVHRRTCEYLATLAEEDLDRVVDTRFDPPVTLGVRLVSVVADDLQHIGQAGYVKGLLRRRR